VSTSFHPRHVVVTGASGNVGLAVVAALTNAGHRVTGVCRRLPDNAALPFAAAGWRSADLTSEDSLAVMVDVLDDADAVVHLAWGFQPSHRPDYLESLAVGGTARVAQAVVESGVPHLVHMSSVGVYSPRVGPEPVSEDYPRRGVTTSPYSRHKAAAEHLLDSVEDDHPDLVVSRLRPGIVGQLAAGSSLLRYAVPGLLPAGLLRHLPVLPLDRRLEVPVVHAEDVADAVVRVLDRRAAGAFNLATDSPVTVDLLAAALGARSLHVPARVLRAAVTSAWRARIEQLDPGWIDLAYAVPLLDTTRAENELDWHPAHSAVDVVADVLEGMMTARSAASPALRGRTVADTVRDALSVGPVHRRLRP
jgi:UDP-glucose 4-epimerase